MTDTFNPRVNTDNPDPRVPCVLLLDTSGSMQGTPIDELNRGLIAFAQDILEDPLARKRTEVMVISFGGGVHSDPSFVEAQHFQPPTLTAMGHTPIAEALLVALRALDQQKDVYKQAGIEYFRPWLVVMTDGEPTDQQDTINSALSTLAEAERRKAVTVFPIGIGDRADMAFLNKLTSERDAVRLRDLDAFSVFFTDGCPCPGRHAVDLGQNDQDGVADSTQVSSSIGDMELQRTEALSTFMPHFPHMHAISASGPSAQTSRIVGEDLHSRRQDPDADHAAASPWEGSDPAVDGIGHKASER